MRKVSSAWLDGDEVLSIEPALDEMLAAIDRLDQKTYSFFGLECQSTGEKLLIGGGNDHFIVTWELSSGESFTLCNELTTETTSPEITIGGQPAEYDPFIVVSLAMARQALVGFVRSDEPGEGTVYIKN